MLLPPGLLWKGQLHEGADECGWCPENAGEVSVCFNIKSYVVRWTVSWATVIVRANPSPNHHTAHATRSLQPKWHRCHSSVSLQLLRDDIGKDFSNLNVEALLKVNIVDGKTGSRSIPAVDAR